MKNLPSWRFPFAVFDEFGRNSDDSLQDQLHAAQVAAIEAAAKWLEKALAKERVFLGRPVSAYDFREYFGLEQPK